MRHISANYHHFICEENEAYRAKEQCWGSDAGPDPGLSTVSIMNGASFVSGHREGVIVEASLPFVFVELDTVLRACMLPCKLYMYTNIPNDVLHKL